MAISNSLGTFFVPGQDDSNAYTKHKMDMLQTLCAGKTQGLYKITKSVTADTMYLHSINMSIWKVTNTTQVLVMYGTETIGATPVFTGNTSGARQLTLNFAPYGLLGPNDATTNAVSLNIVGATANVIVIAQWGEMV